MDTNTVNPSPKVRTTRQSTVSWTFHTSALVPCRLSLGGGRLVGCSWFTPRTRRIILHDKDGSVVVCVAVDAINYLV